MNKILISIFLFFVASVSTFSMNTNQDNTYQVLSPDGTIRIDVQAEGRLTYSVKLDGQPLIIPSGLGLVFADRLKLGEKVSVVEVKTSRHNEKWQDNFSKFSTVTDNYSEITLRLSEQRPLPALPVEFEVIFRAYNDGVAFRYRLPKQEAMGAFTLTEESTRFLFAADHRSWVGANTSYENTFPEIKLSQLTATPKSLPLLMETTKGYVAVAEADVLDWSGISLAAAGGKGNYGVSTVQISPVESQTPRQSPWRALIIGRTAGELTVSTLLRNLATPCKISDISWIKPGIAAWDVWWTGQNPYWDKYKGLESRGNTQSHKDYIDLAAEMGWQYMLVDWFWYDQESPDPETAIKPQDHINMPELMSYAKSKGVKLILWVNSKNISAIGMEKLFATYSQWGAVGVKVDFFPQNGSQKTLRWQEELLECAARYHLFIDFHGTYTPTGLSRTWPNLLTQEGVLGTEYAKLGRDYTPEHMMRLPFTRGLLGFADVTPGAFINVRDEHFVPNAVPAQVSGTRARQLALSVLMDSPLLVLCDAPQNYRGEKGFEFYRGLPTTWDETRVLSSDLMGHLVQARRKGDSWWIAAMNNDKPLNIPIKLNFLGKGQYSLESFGDSPESATQPSLIGEVSREVNINDVLEIRMEKAGGFVARIKLNKKP